MRDRKELLITIILLVIVASLYRVIPGRPWGFTPQIAMAIFGGAIIRNKPMAFLIPILSLFISDLLYEILYLNGVGNIQGFYGGQVMNYILITSMTIFGFFIKSCKISSIFIAALSAPTAFFLLSNFEVWLSSGGLNRPKSLSGLVQCFQDGLPFYPWSVVACVVFSALFFGSHYFFFREKRETALQVKAM